MEYIELADPEEIDYNTKHNNYYRLGHMSVIEKNFYAMELANIIGVPRKVTDERLMRDYGITMTEYDFPNKSVIKKVRKYLDDKHK